MEQRANCDELDEDGESQLRNLEGKYGSVKFEKMVWEQRKALFETRFRAPSQKYGDSRKAAAELEVEIQAPQAGEEEATVRRNPSDAASIQPFWSRSSHLETRA